MTGAERLTNRDTGTGRRSRARAGAVRARLGRILRALRHATPSPEVELEHRSAFELLVATILSAQSTDRIVNQVTPRLFRRYRTPADFAEADRTELERLIRPTGFYQTKARHLINCARAVIQRFGGRVPRTMDDLVTLPGVGRKTANVVLGNAFGQPAVVVDTHVIRVSHRLGLARGSTADQIERELRCLMPQEAWTVGSQRLLLHGRYVCVARRPRCEICGIYAECPWSGKPPR